ncbi:fibronectin type III-like domain-contianing protein [Microbacterium panaciterrae]|uniref:Fibronectin type III-like domain-containing protein n=1 Tax=Microbacterium panaciterrae TaxID=985759 RepID=A0ABP8P2U3_9MICO
MTNTGDRAGTATPQLYLRVYTAGVTRPAQQLAGFARVELAPGESRRIAFTVYAEQLVYTNLTHDFAIEPAIVDWFIGFGSDDRCAEISFEVEGETRLLATAERVLFSDVAIA